MVRWITVNSDDALGFGTHLILDGFRADAERLSDPDHIEGVLRELVVLTAGGDAAAAEVIAYTPDAGPSEGRSAAIVRAELYLAVHTFPAMRKLTLDLFSTRTVPVEAVSAAFRTRFGVGRQESAVHGRGRLLPVEAESLRRVLRGDRDYARLRLRDLLGA